MGFVGILLSLSLLIYFAYRGVSVIILAPLLALLAVLMDASLEMLPTYTEIFMTQMGGFIAKLFPMFLLGSIFGKLMERSGFAESISKGLVRSFGKSGALTAIVLACGLLTYGGVSAFVVCFSMFPLARQAFTDARISHRLIPGSLALGALTFSMTCFPGTVQVHNLIPMPYFKTTPFAAPTIGIIAGLCMMIFGLLWLNYRRKIEPYYEIKSSDHVKLSSPIPFWVAILPIIAVIVLNYIFSESAYNIGTWTFNSQKFQTIEASKYKGSWSMILSLFLASLFIFALAFKTLYKNIAHSLEEGAKEAMLPAFNTGSEVGYGATIAALAAFASIKSGLIGLSPHNPLLTEWLSINVLAGITGSASGGLAIALGAMGDSFRQLAQANHISMEYLHRIASMASGGLDSLPHNGAVITLLVVCKMTHKDSYKDIFVVSVLIPLIVTLSTVLILS
ncbi:MAG: GntP family permease [Bdellovibrionota bacterium]